MMEAESTTSPCQLCGATERKVISRSGQFGLPANVVVCMRCGFSFLDPRWTKERYDRFYASEYDRYYRPEVLAQNDERTRFLPIEQVAARLKERGLLRRFGAVLDLGSGMGHALTYLRSHHEPDARYDAIEPSETCKQHLIGEGFGHLSDDVYSDWDRDKAGRYGLVIMRHVLEHFDDPLIVLKKVREVLSDDGLLYIAVPDALHPTKPLRSHFFRVVHISYFSRHSLKAMLERSGLEVIDIVEGDRHASHEIFAVCRKGAVKEPVHRAERAMEQIAVYRRTGRMDLFHEAKGALISIARRSGLLR